MIYLVGKFVVEILANVQDSLPVQTIPDIQKLPEHLTLSTKPYCVLCGRDFRVVDTAEVFVLLPGIFYRGYTNYSSSDTAKWGGV